MRKPDSTGRFVFVPPEQFFELLYDNHEFCREVGHVVIAASRLETVLRKYLIAKGIARIKPKSTLGYLVRLMKSNNLLTRNGEVHFDDLASKRNYLAHSLYDLFTEEIEETILERDELTAGDVDLFISRAEGLAKDFLYFAEIVESDNGRDGVLSSQRGRT